MVDEIKLAELLRALEDAEQNTPSADGYSKVELAEMWKVSQAVACRRIRSLVHAGVMEYVGRALRTTIMGTRFPTPVYRRKGAIKGPNGTGGK